MKASGPISPYASHLAFYEHAYGQHIAESHVVGGLGTSIFVAEQSAGDWSDAPTPDLVITRLATAPIKVTCDIGSGRQRLFVPPRSFVVVPPAFATTFLIDQAHRVEFVTIPFKRLLTFVGEDRANTLPADGNFGRLHKCTWNDAGVNSLLDTLISETRAGSPHGALGADALLLRLVATLTALRDRQSDANARASLAPWQLKRALERIEADPAEDLSLADLAAAVGLSPSHFCRAFGQSTGVPPHRYRLGRRMVRAKELLTQTQLPITDIALSLGFSSSQHFAAAFRAESGLTPSEWRRKNRI